MTPALVVTAWRARGFGRVFPCSIGRGGITDDKREGDWATPVGPLRVAQCFYRADRMASPAPWAQAIGPGEIWCDDPGHSSYNHLEKLPFSSSHERMRRADRLYDLVLTTDWNWPVAVPGKGSAIFIHRWRGPRYPTAGCVAFRPVDLRWLAARLAPGSVIEVRG